jgi:hypothetical protein
MCRHVWAIADKNSNRPKPPQFKGKLMTGTFLMISDVQGLDIIVSLRLLKADSSEGGGGDWIGG